MTYAAKTLYRGARRVLWWQAGLTTLAGIVTALLGGPHGAIGRFLAALAGGSIAMLSTVLLVHSVGRTDAQGGSVSARLWLYGGAVTRFLLVIVLIGLGLGLLGLSPLPFLVAFGLGQLAFLAAGLSLGP
ncbi:MAG TPA: ATP synthase subunit I [Acidiferrobacter sp.]|nr:ATP synthase subunit I [Acidiferrobacter sp.]